MANNDDVLIVGSLKDEELRKSIDNLVDYVGDKTNEMAMKFNDGLDKMKLAMKDFAVTQKVSVDLMKQAWREMSTSFDAMVAAQSGATGGGSGSGKPAYAPNTVGALEQEIKLREQNLKLEVLDTDQLKQANRELENRKELLAREKGLNTMAEQARQARKELQAALTTPSNTLEQAEKKLKNLKDVASKFPKASGVLDAAQWNRLQNAIDKTREKIEKLNMATPTLKTIKGMDEKSVDDISKKLRALRNVQVDPKNTAQVKKLGDEYQRLTRLQNELLGKGIQLTKSNNYLAQSFGYIRNRIVYALTLGAATSFVKQVYEIRAQYELLERSLGVLIGSFERGSQIFQELNTMALNSPFTLMELGTAAKQLTAYNFKANEVVNTTRRLADLSAALGVPMERLTYNLGQIRAQTVLTARDARDFANAGLPIVKSLADYFSQLEGRVVTTGDVFDRMSKKAVSYTDVMAVLNQMTDEGGKFFDFQAKQAETLRVQLANLTLAWNNMLNDVGEANQGLLTAPIVALKSLFQNWGEISHVITEVVIALGLYKGTQLVVNRLMGESAMVMKKSILVSKEKAAADLEREATTRKLLVSEKKQITNKGKIVAADYQAILSTRELTKTQALLLAAFNKQDKELMKALVKMKLLKKAEIENITVGKALGIVLKQVGISIASLGKTIAMFMPQMAAMAALGAIVEAVYTWSEISDKIKDINKSIVDSSKESADSIAKFLNDYRETYRKAFEYSSKVAKNGVPTNMADGAPKYKNLNDEEAQKAWQAIKEQIELSSAASSTFISRLMAINDVNDRVRAGFDYLEKIHDVNGALETLDEKAIDIAGDWSKWWNLWTLPDGLIDNLKDYQNQLDKVAEKWGSLANARAASEQKIEGADGDLHDVVALYGTFVSDLQKTTATMYNAFTSVGIDTAEGMREAFEKSNQKILADGNLSSKEQLQYNMAAEKQFIDYRKSLFEEEYAFEKGRGNMERAERIREEENAWVQAFGSGRAVSDAFFNWLKNQHASEITKMFGNMSKKELEQLDWSEEKWQKWARDNAESFSKQYGISFDNLKNLVNEANTWKIFLKLFITTDEKGVYDTLKDADAAANTAWSKIQRLKQRQAELNNIPASQLTDIQKEQSSKILGEITQAQNDLNDAIAKGGHVTKNKTKASKEQKTAEQDVADALRQELAVIRDIQSNYDKLRKSGVDNMDAINIATQGYADTLYRVNSILKKYGVNKFNAKEFAGKDVHKLLETLQKQRDDLVASGKIKTGSLKDLDVEIQKLTVDAKTYDMKKVTDGLNNELAKVKEEYELAVEFDANPELGGVFADMMGINADELNQLPRTYEQVVAKLQSQVDRLFADNNLGNQFDLVSLLNKNDFEAWAKAQGNTLDDSFIKALDNIRQYANKVRLDEASETTKNWSQLVEKYGDLQAKLVKIAKQTGKEQLNIIKKFGTENEKQQALNISEKLNIEQDPESVSRLQRELADLMNRVVQGNPQAVNIATATENEGESLKSKAFWEDFKQSELYSMTFEDMSRVSTSAIQLIIDKLEELRGKVQEDPASMKALTKSLEDARKELEGRSGTITIVNALKEYKKATVDLANARQNLAGANIAVSDAENQLNEAEQAGDATAVAKAVDNLRRARERQKEAEEDVVRGENNVKKSTKKLQAGMETLSSELQNVQGLFDVVAKLFAAGGDDETAEAINAISQGFSVMTTVIMGVVAAMVLLESTQPWLLAIAASLSVIVGLVSWLSGSNKKEIDEQVKKSEIAVKRLENSYRNLEAAMEKAIGAQVIAFQKAEIANKKLQLAELQRQLQLERSRDSKDYDAGKVADLEGQIIDLKNDIQGMKDNITNTFLGINSVSDAVSSMVGNMIDALREGEDAMETFGSSIDDMVANMIKQVFSARIVGPMLEKVWNKIDEEIQKRGEKYADYYADYQATLDHIDATTGGTGDGYYFWKDQSGSLWYSNNFWKWQKAMKAGAENLTYQQWQETLQAWADWAKENLQDATTPTMNDIHRFGADLQGISPELEGYIGELENILREMGLIKDQTKADALSKLQQGIDGVTEDTAGAIEAYMNIVSQRVFEQNEYLMQIRDIIVNFNLDVQVATIGQILYQMQQSYLVQQAIQARLDGWSNSNGMAVRVEMV